MRKLIIALAFLTCSPSLAAEAPVYYQFDENGIYIGSREAQASPLEPGEFLRPGLMETDVAPPRERKGFKLRWNDVSWAFVEDHEGEEVYSKADGTAITLKIGSALYPTYGPIPKGFTATAKPGEFYEFDENEKAWVLDTTAKAAAEAEIARKLGLMQDPDRKSLNDMLTTASPEQIERYVKNKMDKIEDLQSAKQIFGKALTEILKLEASKLQGAQ